jgi:hypothetical protein
LCFSACKLNLPLVPSQVDDLKDNKRCYDNILSECGISDPFQIYSDREFKKKNMHKFHTLQCKNNKLLLSNHHLLCCNIYTLWGSSSSVCDGEHFVLKIHKLLLFDLIFKKYPSCSHPPEGIATNDERSWLKCS